MKQILIFICFISFVLNGFAQSDFGAKFKPIPAAKFPIKPQKTAPIKTDIPPAIAIPPINVPNVFKSPDILTSKPKPTPSSYQIGKTKELSMIPVDEFENPGDVYKEKMEKDLYKTLHENDAPLLRQNFYFGDFKTKSLFLTVKYRDYIYVDGDLLRIYSNGKIIKSELYLEGILKEIKIDLADGINKIDFEALNTGTSGGNTAEIQIYDDKNVLITSNLWDNLAAGYKGSIIMVRE
jgi:hypothetical protein